MIKVLPTKSRATLLNVEENPNVPKKGYAYLVDHNDGLRIVTSKEELDGFDVGATVSVRHERADFVIAGVEILARKLLGTDQIDLDERVIDEQDRRLAHWNAS